ncbi:MAG: DNA methylase [Candidatus Fimisoma sp.]|nr:DNA methylase [Candidatus Fimisoma sp.]
MAEKNRSYIAIDLKSFYASVECIERGLNPMTTNIVVADAERSEKTICLAVSPSLKSHGISGRPRLFQVVQRINAINAERKCKAPGGRFTGSSFDDNVTASSPEYSVDYIVAPPRMAKYMEVSTEIYNIYLKYIAPEDIHVYSIDEVFIDATDYLKTYNMSPRELAMTMIKDVLDTTGITATAGIGTNLYLCKVAMDIEAKHIEPDKDGARIAELDEMSYRRKLWDHRPLTDFWRIGKGYAEKLEKIGLYTMGDIARCSLGGPGEYFNEDMLYRMFGVNAELLIDHAWGWEPCRISDIKGYKPRNRSIGSGQVLHEPYTYEKAGIVVREMIDALSLDLVEKGLVTNQLVLTIGYDIANLSNPRLSAQYRGQVSTDRYGRSIPKHAHGTENLQRKTSSSQVLADAMMNLYRRITDKNLLIRRIAMSANRVTDEKCMEEKPEFQQLDFFTDYKALQQQMEEEKSRLQEERQMQETLLNIKKKFGKNAVLKGMSLQEGATARDKNNQIGGHKA